MFQLINFENFDCLICTLKKMLDLQITDSQAAESLLFGMIVEHQRAQIFFELTHVLGVKIDVDFDFPP